MLPRKEKSTFVMEILERLMVLVENSDLENVLFVVSFSVMKQIINTCNAYREVHAFVYIKCF